MEESIHLEVILDPDKRQLNFKDSLKFCSYREKKADNRLCKGDSVCQKSQIYNFFLNSII